MLMKDDPVAIVVFEPRHIAEARALWTACEGVGLSDADEPHVLESFLARNPGLSLLALQQGRVVATVLCGHDGRRGLIHHLVVAPTCRRQGVGRLLLNRGLATLASAGIQKAHLLVFKSNEPGLAFWRAVGAEERVSMALFSLVTAAA
jgi:ribosomal protein S18 acetylase RimI-like enzyme